VPAIRAVGAAATPIAAAANACALCNRTYTRQPRAGAGTPRASGTAMMHDSATSA
jgi:hypothetical protein